jgi:hypothetical protein
MQRLGPVFTFDAVTPHFPAQLIPIYSFGAFLDGEGSEVAY